MMSRSITSRRGSLQAIVWSCLMLSVILCADAAATEQKNVVGTMGQNITLSTGLTGVEHSSLLWSFSTEMFTLAYYSDGQLLETMDRFSGRIHLDTGTGSLLITNLNLNDTGIYGGQVINGASSYYKFNVTILAPVVSPSIEPDGGIAPEPTLTRTTNATTNPSDGSVGAIVGGTLAAVVVIGIAAAAVYLVVKRRNKGTALNRTDNL